MFLLVVAHAALCAAAHRRAVMWCARCTALCCAVQVVNNAVYASYVQHGEQSG
jgi:hypothetical protein